MYNQYRAPINEDDYQHKEDKDQSQNMFNENVLRTIIISNILDNV